MFNSLEPSDNLWWYTSGLTFAQVMAYCLTAQSHYLNQCARSSVIHLRAISPRYISAIKHKSQHQNYFSEISFKSPKGQWVTWWKWLHGIVWKYKVILHDLSIRSMSYNSFIMAICHIIQWGHIIMSFWSYCTWYVSCLLYILLHVIQYSHITGLILGLHPANESWCYFVTSLIGWVQASC